MSGEEFPDDFDPDSIFTPTNMNSDEVFDILSNKRRRLVIFILREEGAIDLTELTERIASIEYNKPIEKLDGQDRKRVYVGLYQVHLPKLEEAGFIEFNQDSGIVEATDALFEFNLNFLVSKEENVKFLDYLQIIVILLTSGALLVTIAPTITNVSINTGLLAIVMAFLSSLLATVYYLDKRSGPNIDDIIIRRE